MSDDQHEDYLCALCEDTFVVDCPKCGGVVTIATGPGGTDPPLKDRCGICLGWGEIECECSS